LKRKVLWPDFFRASTSFAKNFGTSLLDRTATLTSEDLSPNTFANVVAGFGLEYVMICADMELPIAPSAAKEQPVRQVLLNVGILWKI
jgi:hypothetical protein